MKLITKWVIFFGSVCLIVMVLSGLWYSRLFNWVFEEKLKQELVALIYVNQSRFVSSVVASPSVVTIEEMDTMNNFRKDPRVVYALVINGRGQIRWAPDPDLFGKALRDLNTIHPLPTDAILLAASTKAPRAIAYSQGGQDYYEVAVPFERQGKLAAIVSIEVSRKEAQATASEGMKKFAVGSLIIGLLLVIAGAVFIVAFVGNPLRKVHQHIENLSLTNPVLPLDQTSRDEIGMIQHDLAVFFEKLRHTVIRAEKDLKDLTEVEKKRWEYVLKVLVRSGSVLVLDADNYVLAGHNTDSLTIRQTVKAQTPAKRIPGLPVGVSASPAEAHLASPAALKTHLLDFITSTDLLQIINRALEKPGNFVNGNVILEAVPYSARVVTLAGVSAQEQRTIVWLEPQAKA